MIFQQEANEDIKIIVRRHWAVIIGLVIFALVMLILPIILYSVLRSFVQLKGGIYSIFILGLGIYYMFVLTLLYIGWLDYYLDVAIITNERIVDIDQDGLFNRTVSELHLSKIQDVSGNVKGIVGTMMDFGDVKVQTAGTTEEFILDTIPHPYKVSKMIIDLHQKCIECLAEKTRLSEDV